MSENADKDNFRLCDLATFLRSANRDGVHIPHVISTPDPDADPVLRISQPIGSDQIGTGQVSINGSATLIAIRNEMRRSALIRNIDDAISIYVGGPGVTASNGMLVKAGEVISITTRAALYAVSASGSPKVAWLMESD